MNWEERLSKLNEYNVSFEIKQGYYHIALQYDNNWNILVSDNENIYIQEKNGTYHYIASTDSIKIDELFNLIDSTIEYNLDLQKKLLLFRQKTEELQEIFSTESYDKLKTIEFTFPKQKKSVKKAKQKEKTIETNENNADNDSTEIVEEITTEKPTEVIMQEGEYLQELEK